MRFLHAKHVGTGDIVPLFTGAFQDIARPGFGRGTRPQQIANHEPPSPGASHGKANRGACTEGCPRRVIARLHPRREFRLHRLKRLVNGQRWIAKRHRAAQIRRGRLAQKPRFVVIVGQQLIEQAAEETAGHGGRADGWEVQGADDQLVAQLVESVPTASLALEGFVPHGHAG